MNRKKDRLLTPALSSFEEEREKRGAQRFRESMREMSSRGFSPLPPGTERGVPRSERRA
jgi:hypothetical protein